MPNKEELTQLIGVSTSIILIFFILLAIAILSFVFHYRRRYKQNIEEKIRMQQAFQQQLLQSQIETQEATFESLGKELHDNICQLLNSARMMVGVSQRTTADATGNLELAGDTISKAINEIRDLAKNLNKEWLQQFNLYENLAMEVKRINATGEIVIRVQHDAVIPFESDKQLLLFRIIQEAIQNAMKHARARNISIFIRDNRNELVVAICDDGVGIQDVSMIKGLGMINMQHRVKLLNGTITWSAGDNQKGTTVEIRLPINPVT